MALPASFLPLLRYENSDSRDPVNIERHDYWLLLFVAAVVSFGVVMVASASIDFSADKFSDPWYYTRKHVIFLSLGLLMAFLVFNVPVTYWNRYSIVLLFAALILLSVTIVPGIGIEVNGSRRWLRFGPIGFQSSEVAKLCFIIFFASFLSRKTNEFQQGWNAFFILIGIVLAFIGLLLAEPDFGSAVVICFIGGMMMFLAGVPIIRFILLILVTLVSLAMVAIVSPYRLQRLQTFIDPFAVQYEGGYQLVQSLIGFGRGEWFGLGLGNSLQKLFFLPEAHTDFIFAIVAEEFGFIGAIVLVLCFIGIVWRIINIAMIARRLNQLFCSFYAIGVASLISAQVFINMGVASGLLPTKGLTLPFISAGGSSLVITCVLFAIIFRIDWELRAQLRGDS